MTRGSVAAPRIEVTFVVWVSVPLPGPAITTLKILVSLIKELCLATSGGELAGSLI